MSKAYIEIVGSVAAWSIDLTFWHRWRIGEFTRENVERWLANRTSMSPELYPVDFHAVCGDIDIPWATKEAKDIYQGRYGKDSG